MKRKDYMGMLVVNHYSSPDPMPCYGTQTHPIAITEIAVHEAGYDANNKIIKGEMLAKIRMSELQFGRLIARPNTDGNPVTLEHLKGFGVSDKHLSKSPELTVMKEKANRTQSKDEQIHKLIKNIEDIAKESREKKRLVRKSDLLKMLGTVVTNASSNLKYYFTDFSAVATQRVVEAKSQIHSMARNAYRINKQGSLLLESPSKGEHELSCLAKACVYTAASRERLFDAVGTANETAMLEIMGGEASEIDKRLRSASDPDTPSHSRLHFSSVLARIDMSLDQYARFVRADNTEIPCTLRRVGFFVSKDKVVADKREEKMGDIDADANRLLASLVDKAKLAIQIADQKGSLKASERDRLLDICESLDDAYDNAMEDIKGHSDKILEEVTHAYQEEIQDFLKDEVDKLPPQEQALLREKIIK